MAGTGDTSDTSTPPKPSASLHERITGLSVGALIASAAVILVVGLVVGLAAGYKIEQTRVKNDVKDAKKAARAATETTTTLGGAPGQPDAGSLLMGTVDTATPGSVTLIVAGTRRQLALNGNTVVTEATAGSRSDVVAGSRVLVKTAPGSLSNAVEVIVLPATAKLGTNVVAATATSMTVGSGPKTLTMNTENATVDKVAAGQASDITAGAKVIAQTSAANSSTPTATEVVVLPKTSAFVS